MSAPSRSSCRPPRGARAARGPRSRPRRRRLLVADASDGAVVARALPRPARASCARRPPRRQHVGDAARGGAADRAGRSARSSSGSRRLPRGRDPGQLLGRRAAHRRRRVPSAARRVGERLDAPGRRRGRAARALRRRAPAVARAARPAAAAARPTSTEHGRPIRYGYVPEPLAARRRIRTCSPSSPAAPRCRAPAGRSPPELITRSSPRGILRRADHAAHGRLVAGAPRAARTRSAIASRPRPRGSSTPSAAGAAG